MFKCRDLLQQHIEFSPELSMLNLAGDGIPTIEGSRDIPERAPAIIVGALLIQNAKQKVT